jgi:hypothetical protein
LSENAFSLINPGNLLKIGEQMKQMIAPSPTQEEPTNPNPEPEALPSPTSPVPKPPPVRSTRERLEEDVERETQKLFRKLDKLLK